MKFLIVAFALLLSACSNTPTAPNQIMHVIERSEALAPIGYEGTFRLKIRGSDEKRGVTFLNSQLDYRDRRNLVIALHPKLVEYLSKKHQQHPKEYFVNKTIEVRGSAKRTKIRFITNGHPSDKYYYQTHVRISQPVQIRALD